MSLDITGCFKLAENVYVTESMIEVLREFPVDDLSEVLRYLHENYAPEKVTVESYDDSSLCVYTYRPDLNDPKIMAHPLPCYIDGEGAAVSIVVWETEVIAHDHATQLRHLRRM
ncbi:hypothetical protein [Bacillus altitudinis]|uniref:hypothetical protein n=1 Tax=Bacillus altitudinis TaxID=293387 RepID=UPI0025526920|nr:hypothetical protein [Bacillus altitudinis]